MLPRGPLMIEHRLIEKVLLTVRDELKNIKEKNEINTAFTDILVDFFWTYVEKAHHIKEEDYLFKALEEKDLTDSEKQMMADLVYEHDEARDVIEAVDAANKAYKQGDTSAVDIIYDKLIYIAELYPKHIKDEDEVFFPDTEKYFTKEELDKMLNDYFEYDRKLLQEKYTAAYETMKTLV